jgi:hypothetical protein
MIQSLTMILPKKNNHLEIIVIQEKVIKLTHKHNYKHHNNNIKSNNNKNCC